MKIKGGHLEEQLGIPTGNPNAVFANKRYLPNEVPGAYLPVHTVHTCVPEKVMHKNDIK